MTRQASHDQDSLSAITGIAARLSPASAISRRYTQTAINRRNLLITKENLDFRP